MKCYTLTEHMVIKEIFLTFILTCFLGKSGIPFELSWDHPVNKSEIAELTLSSFLESYRQSHAYDNLNDEEIKQHLFEYCKSKNFQEPGYTITARHNDKLAGIAIFEKRDQETVYLAEVMIAPEFWSQGLGRELIFSIFKQEPQFKKIVLLAEKANSRTVRFYQSLGFTESNQNPCSNYATFNYSQS